MVLTSTEQSYGQRFMWCSLVLSSLMVRSSCGAH